MPSKKRQHFVPRFYLKNFSIGSAGKSIGIFNINSKKFIPNGSLREQAYKDYFYGKDGVVENLLEKFEAPASVVIRGIIRDQNYPAWESQDRFQLLIFATFLHSRTEYAADEYNEQTDQMIKTLYPKGANPEDRLAAEISNPPSHAETIRSTMLCTPIASDLDYKIVINDTSVPFITSDNPSVYYNRFLEGRKAHGSNVGLGVKGLQIFLPISPNHLLIFYDSGVYVIGKRMERTVSKLDEYDVNGLNYLQCANAYYNLYFNEDISREYIVSICERMKKYRREAKSFTKEHVIGKLPDGSTRSILHTYRNDLRINLNLSFVRITSKAKAYKLGNKAVHMRNEEFARIYSEFLDAVTRQEYRFDQWDEFFRDWMSRSS